MMNQKLMKGAAILSSAAMMMMHTAFLPAQAEESGQLPALGAIGCLDAAQTQAVAETIYAGLANHQDTIMLPYSPEEYLAADDAMFETVQNIYMTVVSSTDVGILAVKNQIGFMSNYTPDGAPYLKGLTVFYQVDAADYDAAYADAIAKVDAISAQVDDSWSAAEKALFFHDYLAEHYEYDLDYAGYETTQEQIKCHTAYGILTRGKAVCEGYAWLYNLLLAREGIEATIVSSEQIEHAWNLVHLPDGWAHIDVTWDDCYQGFAGRMLHDNFLIGSETRASIIGAMYGTVPADWTTSEGQSVFDMDVTNSYENGFWSTACTNIVPYQGRWLVMNQDAENGDTGWFNLYTYNAEENTASAESILSLTQYWTQPGSDVTYWPGVYTVTAEAGDVIYYTTPTAIHAIVNGQPTSVFDLNAEAQQTSRIYGMYIDGDTLYYDLAADPNGTPVRYSIALADYPVVPTEPATEEPSTEEPTTEESTEPTTEPTTEAPTEPETVEGDLDGDGGLSVIDVIVLTRHLLCTAPMQSGSAMSADVTGDGEVDVFDLAMLKRMLLNQ